MSTAAITRVYNFLKLSSLPEPKKHFLPALPPPPRPPPPDIPLARARACDDD